MEFYFTSGLPNPLHLDQQDRRYFVMDESSEFKKPTPKQQAKLDALEESQRRHDENQARQREIQGTFGKGARVVAPYAPNRKQKRAQARAARRNRSKK